MKKLQKQRPVPWAIVSSVELMPHISFLVPGINSVGSIILLETLLTDVFTGLKVYYLSPENKKSADFLQSSSVSAKVLIAQLPPPSELRVLPTMSLKLLRLKILKALRIPFDRKPSNHVVFDAWLVMSDDKITKLDMEQEKHDLSWWGLQSGSEIVVTSGALHSPDAHK